MTSNPFKTILTIISGLLIFYFFFRLEILLYSSLFLCITSIASKKISIFYEKIWFGIAHILGLFIPNIILSIIFYLILTPIAFLYKKFNNDPLMLKDKTYKSYFVDSKYDLSKNSFEKIW
tara:strand:- start:7008 stop:7367 length:360 start_codon:yes stop_codon:yes gene_type:complete